MNLRYMHRRVSSMNYRLRIVSLASDSMNQYLKPKQGCDLYRIGSRTYYSEVKIGKRASATSGNGSPFLKRMRRVPYATKPSQTRINMIYSRPLSKKRMAFNPNVVRSVRMAPRWRKRLARPAAYFGRFDLRYLNSVRTTSRSLRIRNKSNNTTYISKKM